MGFWPISQKLTYLRHFLWPKVCFKNGQLPTFFGQFLKNTISAAYKMHFWPFFLSNWPLSKIFLATIFSKSFEKKEALNFSRASHHSLQNADHLEQSPDDKHDKPCAASDEYQQNVNNNSQATHNINPFSQADLRSF